MSDPVQLTDLDVITRYSIAVRKATAERDELIETLRADLSWLERGLRRTRPGDIAPEVEEPAQGDEHDDLADEAAEPEPAPTPPADRAPIRRMPAKVTPARRSAGKKTAAKPAAKKAATKKATARRSAR